MSNSSACLYNKNTDIFMSVCRTRSFTKAAKLMGLTPSAVSQAISNFEADLGVTFFDRSIRPIVMLPEAETLFLELSSQNAKLQTLLQGIRTTNGQRPNLKLGLIESASLAFGADLIDALSKKFGKIEVSSESIRGLLMKLKTGEIELFVSSHPIAEDDALSRIELFTEPFVTIFPKHLCLPKNITWVSISKCGIPMIRSPQKTYNRKIMDTCLENLEVTLPIRFEVESTAVTLDLISRNLGWSMSQPLSLYPYRSQLQAIKVRELPPPVKKRTLYLISLKGHETAPVQALQTFIQHWVKDKLFSTFPNINFELPCGK